MKSKQYLRHIFSPKPPRWLMVTLLSLLPVIGRAQTVQAQAPAVKAGAPLTSLMAAAEFRTDVVLAVLQNQIAPTDAVSRLKAQVGASGIKDAPAEADYAQASLQIAYELMALERPDLADVFFRTAEEGFTQVASRTSRLQAKEKAGYLEKLAYIRGRYLNKIDAAKADMAEAISLQPDDASLKERLTAATRGQGAGVQATSRK